MDEILRNLPLRDIHLPEPVSWWPPAFGWWLLFLLLAAAVMLTVIWRRRQRKLRLRRAALRQFEHLHAVYASNHNASVFVKNISALLRSVCVVQFYREQSASLTGEQWLNFLDQQLSDRDRNQGYSFSQTGRLLVSAPYQPELVTAVDEIEHLAQVVRRWIKSLPMQ